MSAPFQPLQDCTVGPAERKAVAEAAAHAADFNWCGRRLRIRSNTMLPLRRFSEKYDLLLLDTDSPGAAPERTITCVHERTAGGRTVTFLVDDLAYRTSDATLIRDLHLTLAHLALVSTKSHYMLHAACLCRRQKAMVICGASRKGKSTLTTSLAARGMGCLSDEIAPIDRKTGLVEPFPLHLGIRPGPGRRLVKDIPGRNVSHRGDRKKLIDPQHLAGGRVTEPVPLAVVVFLSETTSTGAVTPSTFAGDVKVSFPAVPPRFKRDLLSETGATLVDRTRLGERLVALSLEVPEPGPFLARVYRVCDRHGIPLAGLQYEDLEPVDFSKEPSLMELRPSIGVIELLKRMSPSQKKNLVDTEMGGALPRLVSEMARITADVGFYRISSGRLDLMVRAAEGLL